MFKSKQNNGISKVRPNGDTPLSITPTPMGDAPRPSDWAIQAEKDKSKSEKAAPKGGPKGGPKEYAKSVINSMGLTDEEKKEVLKKINK